MSDNTPEGRYDRAVTAIEQPVADLVRYSRRTRRLMWSVAVSVVFDICLSVALGVVALQANAASTATQSAAVSIAQAGLSNCLANNEFRRNNAALWKEVLPILVPGSSPAAAAERDRVDQLTVAAYAQRKCAELNRIPHKP